MWERGEIAPKEQFLLFFTLFYIYISNFRSQITYSFVKCVVQFIVFLTVSTLICRGTDISKCFSESLGIRDNESRLYLFSDTSWSFSYNIGGRVCKSDPSSCLHVCVCNAVPMSQINRDTGGPLPF